MNIISIIPARGGSKGVPRKNIKLLAGKPLIAHSIELSLGSKSVNRTIVSTDDQEIAEIAKKYGAEVITRPKELATDTAATEPVLQHVVKCLEEKEKYKPDLIILLQPTSPLRKKDDIENALKQMAAAKADSLLSARKFHGFLWKKTDNDKKLFKAVNYDFKNRPRRQDMEQYMENGSIYITKRDILMNDNCRLGGKITCYVMDEWYSADIDTESDFLLVEQMLSRRKKEQNL